MNDRHFSVEPDPQSSTRPDSVLLSPVPSQELPNIRSFPDEAWLSSSPAVAETLPRHLGTPCHFPSRRSHALQAVVNSGDGVWGRGRRLSLLPQQPCRSSRFPATKVHAGDVDSNAYYGGYPHEP
jgi:hypothetical protein